jgi:hypothetical protein
MFVAIVLYLLFAYINHTALRWRLLFTWISLLLARAYISCYFPQYIPLLITELSEACYLCLLQFLALLLLYFGGIVHDLAGCNCARKIGIKMDGCGQLVATEEKAVQ